MNYKELLLDTTAIIENQEKILEGCFEDKYIQLPIGEVPLLEAIKFNIRYSSLDSIIFLNGRVSTFLEHPCVRCLESVDIKIDEKIEYLLQKEEENILNNDISENGQNVIYYSGKNVDLKAILLEVIFLAIPEKVLCREDCKGLCTVCGKDLNEDPEHKCEALEEFVKDELVNPFEKLKDINL